MKLINQASISNTAIASLEGVLLQFTYFKNDKSYVVLDQYVGPDWVHTVFKDGEKLIGLIKTDHPSPSSDAKELQRMSRGKYTFDKVYSLDGTEFIHVNNIEEYMDDFFFYIESMYYYCVDIEHNIK